MYLFIKMCSYINCKNYLINFIPSILSEVDIMDVHEEKEGIIEERTQNQRANEESEPKQKDETVLMYEKDNLFSHKFLFGVIFSRCRDVSATVRAKVDLSKSF